MRIGKWSGLVAALCLCFSAALADGLQMNGIPQNGALPTGWTTRETGEYLGYLLDGNAATVYEHVCRNESGVDSIPDVTFYFSNATLKNIWIRNGNQSDRNAYFTNARIRQLNISVYTTDGSAVTYQVQLQDAYDPDSSDSGWIDGYQCIALPRTFRNVYRLELWMPSWQPGNGNPDTVCISDIAFMPDDSGSSLQPTSRPVPQQTAGYSGYYPQVRLNQRMATRSGPGTQYTELGSYFEEGTTVTAVSAAYDDRNGIWWIQTEFTYLGEKRRAYTGVKRLDMQADDVQQEYPVRSVVVNRSVYAYWGPGYEYTMHKDPVPAGTEGTIYQIENGYAQFEYYDNAAGQLKRVWVPESAIEAQNG